MKTSAYTVVLVASVAVAFTVGEWSSQLRASAAPARTSAAVAEAPQPLEVTVSAATQQLMDAQVTDVRTEPGRRSWRLFGRITADERRVYAVNAGIEGTILDVANVTTGSQVRANQLLARYTAPELLMAMQAFILAAESVERQKPAEAPEGRPSGDASPVISTNAGGLVVNGNNSNLRQRVDRLHLLGMSDVQMAQMRRTRTVPESINILAPADGIVLERNVSPGRKFARGDEWFRIADLRRVWIVVDVTGRDAEDIRPGTEARIKLRDDPRVFVAHVSDVAPQFNLETRTRTIRLEADNPGLVLRPGMFADVELTAPFAAAIVVPSDAVIETAGKPTVFVERSPGSYEPRLVETGWRHERRIEIVKGLVPGDRIVTSGAFLLESQSRSQVSSVGVAPSR